VCQKKVRRKKNDKVEKEKVSPLLFTPPRARPPPPPRRAGPPPPPPAAGPGPLDVGDLPEEIREGVQETAKITLPIGLSMADVERRMIEATLTHTRGDREQAASILGIGLRTLHRRLVAYRRDPRRLAE